MAESEPNDPQPHSLLLSARRLLGRVRRSFAVDTFDVFLRAVRAEDAGFEAPEGYEFRFAKAADIQACEELHTELDARERAQGVARLELGHHAVLGLHEGRVVFSMWVNPRNLNVPAHIKRKLSAERVFIYKAFTSPEHRGRKLYQAGMRFVLAWLEREGRAGLVGYAHVKKAVSRAGLARLEFHSLGRFTRVDWPLFRHTFVSTQLARELPEVVPPSGALPGELAEVER